MSENNNRIDLNQFYGKSELAKAFGLNDWRSLKEYISHDLETEINKDLGKKKTLSPYYVAKIHKEVTNSKGEFTKGNKQK